MKKQSRIVIVGVIAVALILIGIVAIAFAAGGGKGKYDTQLEMAQKYLDELNYEQAIVELRMAIEIEPDNSEAYFVLAEVYVAMEDYESVITVLEEGYAAAGDTELLAERERVAEELESMRVTAASSPELMSEPEENGNLDNEAEGEENRDELANAQESVDIPKEPTWVDDLYNKMIAGDYEAVFEIITAPDFIEKCDAFEHEEMYWSMDYTLLTNDGKIVWVLNDLEFESIHVAYSYHTDDQHGKPIYGEDYVYSVEEGRRSWLYDQIYHYADESTQKFSANEIVQVFHM